MNEQKLTLFNDYIENSAFKVEINVEKVNV